MNLNGHFERVLAANATRKWTPDPKDPAYCRICGDHASVHEVLRTDANGDALGDAGLGRCRT